MKFNYLLVLGFGLVACGGDKGTDTGAETGGDADTDTDADSDTDTDADADAAITAHTDNCTGSVTTLTATTTGDVAEVHWFLTDNGNAVAWSENHQLGGSTNAWSVALDHVTDANDVENGVATLYDCTYIGDAAQMTHLVAAFDAAGNQVDCEVWGADTAGVLDESNAGANPIDPSIDLTACTAR